jgi:hypothetical protein
MAAMTKNENFFKWPKLLYFKPESLKRDPTRIISAKFG